MSKHTPGPWFQSHRKSVYGGYQTEVYTADGEVVATVAWYPRELNDTTTTTDREPNARLIAAAPDLYDAAENALDVLIGCCVAGDGVGDRRAMLDAQHMLRAAIRKTYDRTLVECYIRED